MNFFGRRTRVSKVHHPTTTKIDLFGFATEIRLKIYAELLVRSEPIVFVASHDFSSPPFIQSKRLGLCPAILRLSKRVYSEASPLLYSNNCFEFLADFKYTMSPTNSAHIAPFLSQIGSQASLIHRIGIPFPLIKYHQPGGAGFYEAGLKILDVIRDTCTSITTLKLSLTPGRINYKLDNSYILGRVLDLLNAHFKTIPSLKEIILEFQVFNEKDVYEDNIQNIRDCGWTVKIKKLPYGGWANFGD